MENIPSSITHVYTKEHNTKGLDSRFKGPFEILSRPSSSTILIKVGINKDSSDRTELRHWSDVRPAYLRPDAVEAERPKRGRPKVSHPSKSSSDTSSNQNIAETESPPAPNLDPGNSNRPTRSTRNPAPNYIAGIDFSKPPPSMAPNSNSLPTPAEHTGPPPFSGFLRQEPWSASIMELNAINASISTSPVRCEARG